MISSQIHIGPLTLSVVSIILLLSALGSSLIIFIRFRKTYSGKIFFDKLSTSVIIAFAGWKLFPLFTSLRYIKSPLSLLYISGGVPGMIFGLTAAAVYLVAVFTYKNSLRKELLRILGIFSIIFLLFSIAIFAFYGIFPEKRTEKAPDFTAADMNGSEISLSGYRGKTVILNFWATWCPPCKAEIPELINFEKNISGKNAVLIGINADSGGNSKDSVKEYIREKGINYPVIPDPGGRISNLYGIKTLPSTIVISGDGKIVLRHTGAVSTNWLESQLPDKRKLLK